VKPSEVVVTLAWLGFTFALLLLRWAVYGKWE